jgi:LPS export ABC transporter protein LptC
VRTLLAIGCAVLLLAGCEERVRPSVERIPLGEIASQESWNSTIRFSDSAKVRAVLWAGHIASFTDEAVTLLDDSIKIDFYNEQGLQTSTLTAHRGKVNDRNQDFAAYENVVVVSDSGTTLRTDSLFWRNADRKIHTDAFVDISSPREHIMGHGLISDQSLKNYRIFRVTGQARTEN